MNFFENHFWILSEKISAYCQKISGRFVKTAVVVSVEKVCEKYPSWKKYLFQHFMAIEQKVAPFRQKYLSELVEATL